jgi:glycosyltransferase involved in cell wall biosynthesis
MTANQGTPSVSVCIPTYKRPQLLERAVASVFAQTWQDWELIISDDEDPPGEAWRYLEDLQRQDARVTVIRGSGAHGQVPNTNRTLLAARGTWLKPLHDDDVLRPDCLETLASATRGLPSVVMVSGLVAHYMHGQPVANWRRWGKGRLELIRQKYTHLAMYLQDCPAGQPTQVMVHRKAIERGALLADVPGIIVSVDALWNCDVLKHGDLLFVNRVVAEHHQGHETTSSGYTADELAAEYPIVLRRELENIDPSLKPPRLDIALGMVRCIRVLHHFKNRNVLAGLRVAAQVRHASSCLLAARWVVNQAFPGVLHAVPRIPVQVQGIGHGGDLGAECGRYTGAAKETHR